MMKAKSLDEIFLEDKDVLKTCKDVNELVLLLRDIEAINVIYNYEDDNAMCYIIEYTVGGKKYIHFDVWCGDRSRMYYQAEISKEVQNKILRPYIAEKILRDAIISI